MPARVFRTLLVLLPLAASLFLLRLMPQVAQAQREVVPSGSWRLHPLALVGLVILALGQVGARGSLPRTLRLVLGVGAVQLALLAAPPILQLLLLCAATLILVGGLGPRWHLALVSLSIAVLVPELSARGLVGRGMAGALAMPALAAAALVGLGGVPLPRGWATTPAWELLVRPFWLFPLLQSFAGGPRGTRWALVVPLAGLAAMLVAGLTAIRSRDPGLRAERVLAIPLAMALIASGMSSTLGVIAALWALLAHALLLLFTGGGSRGAGGAVTFVLLFVAAWWAVAAVAAAGAFLMAALICLAWLVGGAASVVYARTIPSSAPPPAIRREALSRGAGSPLRAGEGTGWLLSLLAAGLALFSPLATRFAAIPVAEQLDPGLTPFGRVELWPWIGAGGLDAASRRVALLPGVALALLALVMLAATWLVLRLAGRPVPSQRAESPAPDEDVVSLVAERVWWMRSPPGG